MLKGVIPAAGGGGGSGTVTEIDTGAGLTGGPITNSGTVLFANIAASSLLGNPGTAAAAPSTAIAIGANLTLSTSGTLSVSGAGGSGSPVSFGTIAWGAGAVAANGTIDLTGSAARAAHILSAVFDNGSGGGAITAAAQIGTTPVTGLSAVVMNTQGTASASGANAVVTGNVVRVVFTSVSGTIGDGGYLTILGTID